MKEISAENIHSLISEVRTDLVIFKKLHMTVHVKRLEELLKKIGEHDA